jgi:hypothetical protein
MAIPVGHSYTSYRDVDTGEELASYNFYRAGGGWLMRFVGFWGTGQPLTIHPSICFSSKSVDGLK